MAISESLFNLGFMRRCAAGIVLGAVYVIAPPMAHADPELAGPPAESGAIEDAPAEAPATSNAPANLASDEGATKESKSPAAPKTESLPLGRAARSPLDATRSSGPASSNAGPGWWAQTGAALLLVIGLIFALKWGAQRMARRAGGIAWQMGPAGRAPSGVLEVLGRYPVARGQSLVLLKMDRRILLLGQTSAGFSTLSEINDPEEVASLLIKTRDDEGATMAARFNELLRDMERDPSIGGDTQEIQSGEPATGPRLPRIGLKGVTA